MSTITAYGNEASGFTPSQQLGGLTAFLRRGLVSVGSPSVDDCYAPQPRPSRHDATIAAARCALGGMIDW
jgi:hypothetical protein